MHYLLDFLTVAGAVTLVLAVIAAGEVLKDRWGR